MTQARCSDDIKGAKAQIAPETSRTQKPRFSNNATEISPPKTMPYSTQLSMNTPKIN
jgi:hypothetical protein